jgi:cytochrome P450
MTTADLPQAGGSWLTGVLSDRLRLGASFYGAMARQHGDVIGLRLATWRFVLLSHPDAVRHVLREHPQKYSKGDLFGSLRTVLGVGLFFAEGADWKAQRRTLQPAFHPAALGDLVPCVRACVRAALPAVDAAVASGQPIDVYALVTRIALDVIGRSLFGSQIDRADTELLAQRIAELSRLLDERTFSLVAQAVPTWFPIPLNVRLGRVIHELHGWLDARIQARREALARGEPAGDDLLGALLAARDPDTGAELEAVAVRDQVMTFFLAGHETTASTLAWALALLSQHPTWAAAVRSEARTADLSTADGGAGPHGHQPGALRDPQDVPARLDAHPASARRRRGGGHPHPGRHQPGALPLRHAPATRGSGTNRTSSARSASHWPRHNARRTTRSARVRARASAAGSRRWRGWSCSPELLGRYEFEPAWTGELRIDPSVTLRPADGVPVRVRSAPSSA